MAVNYTLKDTIKCLIVCLYNPSGSSEETQYTFSSLWDYISDCGWQLEQGERVRRFPYHIASCLADAQQEQARFKSMISSLRKEKATNNTDSVSSSDNNAGHRVRRTADHDFLGGKVYPRGVSTATTTKVTPPKLSGTSKRFLRSE